MNVDSVGAQYEIPGFEIAPRAFEPEEVEDDPGDAPYSLSAMPLANPSPGGWQQMLGLDQIPPTPHSIDPPARPPAGSSRPGSASHGLRAASGSGGTASAGSSASVRRMMAMVAQARRDVARIRARAAEGAR